MWRADRLAWTLSAASILLVIAAFGIAIRAAIVSGDYQAIMSHQALTPFVTIIYAVIGALVAARQTRNSIGWIFVAVGLLSALNALAAAIGVYGQSSSPLSSLFVWLGNWLWIPGIFLPTTFVLLVFPDGRLPSSRWRFVAWSAALGLAMSVLAVMLHPGPLSTWGLDSNPYGIPAAAPALDVLVDIGAALLVLGVIGALAGFSVRFRRSAGVEREQMKWLAYAGAMMVLGFALSSMVWFFWPEDPLMSELSIALTDLSILGIAVAATIAILRYRLYDINLIINRTLVYGALTAGVAAFYGLVVGVTGIALQTSSNLAALLLTMILTALIFRPLHGQVQRGVDRLMFGARAASRTPAAPPSKVSNGPHTTEKSSAETIPLSYSGLTGRRLTLARVIWVVLVVLAITLWIIGSFAYATEPPPSCAATACDPFEFSAEDLVVLQDLHLPLGLVVGVWTAATIVLGFVFFAIAGLIFWRKSDDWLGLLVSFTLVFVGAVLFTGSDDALWRTYAELRLPLAIVYTLGFTALMLFLFYFPDGRFVPRGRRTRLAVLLLILLTTPFFTTATRAVTLGTFLSVGIAGLGLAAQIYRYRRISGPVQRQQTKWVMLGLAASIVVMLIWVFTGANFPPDRPGPTRLYFLLLTRPVILTLILLLPITIAFSILRYRLWDIDLVINRALVFGALTAFIVALYVVVVGAFGALFQASGNLLVSLLATGLAALLFQPLRVRLQRRVNRLMYGERDDPVTVFTRLSQRLQAAIAPDAVLPTLVETVAQTLKLPYVAVELGSGDDCVVAAAYGLPADEPVRLPLVHQGETVGHLVVAPRGAGDSLSPMDLKLLENIAHQAGAAVHAVRLTDALQRSRQQLVTAREEERRRIRRDLHDGLGPQLASLTLKLDAARNLLARDPAAADELLGELKTDTQSAIADIRRLVYNLRPPALDELGLVGALREHAASHSTPDGLRIVVKAPEELPPLPAAVEVAAYRIALEALTNVERHARAQECAVRLTLDEALQLEITDDGVGRPKGYHAGVGLTSMRERAAELGGTCVVEARRQGGTRVLAKLPLSCER